jgi:hypothetical protein
MTQPRATEPAAIELPVTLPAQRTSVESLCPLCRSPYLAYGCSATVCRALDID